MTEPVNEHEIAEPYQNNDAMIDQNCATEDAGGSSHHQLTKRSIMKVIERNILLVVLAAIMLAVFTFLGGQLGNQPTSNSPVQQSPQVIREWTGNGVYTTEPFVVNSELWAIYWTHDPQRTDSNSIGWVVVVVYSTAKPSVPEGIVASAVDKTSDKSYFSQRGTYYLHIAASNTLWTVQIIR